MSEGESRKMKFPVVIWHRGQRAKIYGKTPAYPFYRLAYKLDSKPRRVQSFKTYSEAKEAAEQAVRDMAQGSQAAALTTGQAGDAMIALELLEGLRKQTGRNTSLKRAVADYVEAARLLNGRTLAEAVEGYLSTVATVKRKDLAEAVEEFCKGRDAKAAAGRGRGATKGRKGPRGPKWGAEGKGQTGLAVRLRIPPSPRLRCHRGRQAESDGAFRGEKGTGLLFLSNEQWCQKSAYVTAAEAAGAGGKARRAKI